VIGIGKTSCPLIMTLSAIFIAAKFEHLLLLQPYAQDAGQV
jgi:hypothetical protein